MKLSDETYLVEADGEENETTARLNKKRLLLLGEVDLTDKLAVDVVLFSLLSGSVLGSVDLLALGEESGLREVVVVAEVKLGGGFLGWSGVDIHASEAGGDLLGGSLEVVLSDGRHFEDWCSVVRVDGEE